MLLYLLKFSGCLLLFLICYTVFLEREKMHIFKRVYLLMALILSAITPLIIFTEYVEVPAFPATAPISDAFGTGSVPLTLDNAVVTTAPIVYWPLVLWGIYGLGFVLFTYKFIRNLYRILSVIRANPKHKNKQMTHVLLENETVPHTFFNYLFFPKEAYKNNRIPHEVFWHEEAHALQKHSLDIVCIELLQVILWFHPLLYLMKKAIRLNHEFLADQAVLKKGATLISYQSTLLKFSANPHSLQLASALNYSSIKKRFQLMKKHTSKRTMLGRTLILIPVLMLSLYGFTSSRTILKEAPQVQEKTQTLDVSQKAVKTTINGATPKELEAYEKLVARYSAKPYPQVEFLAKLKDMSYMAQVFAKMTAAQTKAATPYPQSPPSLSIIIDNDGNYIVEDEIKTLNEIEALIKQFSPRELANTYVFMGQADYKRYRMKKGQIRVLDDTYIFIVSENIPEKQQKIHTTATSYKFLIPALKDPMVKEYAITLGKLLKKNGVGYVTY